MSSSARSFLAVSEGACEGVVLATGDHVPAQDGELARGGDDGDLHSAPGAHALKERAQRPGGLDGHPGGLDEHPARVRAALPGDPAVRGGLLAGLLDARVQTEVADQLVRRVEPGERADGGGDRPRHRDIDAGDRHQLTWVDTWNEDPRPFIWTKTADQILDSIARYCRRINDSGH